MNAKLKIISNLTTYMNGVGALTQPVLQHRKQHVVRHEEAKVDNVVASNVTGGVVFVTLERRQDGEEAFDRSRL